jgi:hypothetical protein
MTLLDEPALFDIRTNDGAQIILETDVDDVVRWKTGITGFGGGSWGRQ